MVTQPQTTRYGRASNATITAELVVALGILAATLLPLSWSFGREQALCLAYYHRAVAMEIVDGEMEILLGGEWRSFTEGTHDYLVRAQAAQNLPPSKFILTRTAQSVRLEWVPEAHGQGGRVQREVRIPQS